MARQRQQGQAMSDVSAAERGYLGVLRAEPRLLPMLVIVTLVMSGMGVISPVLSLYAAAFGVGTTLIGTTITAFGVARLLVNIPTGFLAERFGRRRLMCAGALVLCVGSVGAALADSFASLVAWRFVQGLGSGCYMTVAMAAAADLSTPGNRGRVMALYQTAILVGAGAGPVFGGIIAEVFGFRAPFWAFALVTLAASVFALAGFTETLADRRELDGAENRGGKGGLGPAVLLEHRAFAAVTLVTFGIFFTRTAAQWQLTPLIGDARFGLSLAAIGLALTAQAAANLAMLSVAGRLVDRFGARRAIAWSTYGLASSLVLVALAPSPWLFFVAVMLVGVSVGVSNPASTAFAADNAPNGRFGPAMGVLRTVGDAGFVLGPILAGLAADLLPAGYTGGMVLNAAVVALGALAFALATGGRDAAHREGSVEHHKA
jgi:multidrug resistance protein